MRLLSKPSLETSEYRQQKFSELTLMITELTGYPEQIVENVFNAVRLCTIEKIADEVIQSECKPGSVEFDVFPFGVVRFTRDLRGKDTSSRFEFVPSEQFYDEFMKAYFEGKTPLVSVIQENFNDSVSQFDRNNLLRLEKLYDNETRPKQRNHKKSKRH